MGLRRGQGASRPEARAGLLPEGIPDPRTVRPQPQKWHAHTGQFVDRKKAIAAGKKGGAARARSLADRKAWGAKLGLGRMLSAAGDGRFSAFVREAEAWFQAESVHLSRNVGGGFVGPDVISILRSAAWQRAWSSFLFDAATLPAFEWRPAQSRSKAREIADRASLITLASKLSDSHRQNLIAAHELAAKTAAARPRPAPTAAPWLESKP